METLVVGVVTVALLWLWNRADDRGVRIPVLTWFGGTPGSVLAAGFVAIWTFAIALLALDMVGAGESPAFAGSGLVALTAAVVVYRVFQRADQGQRDEP